MILSVPGRDKTHTGSVQREQNGEMTRPRWGEVATKAAKASGAPVPMITGDARQRVDGELRMRLTNG